MVEAVSTLLFFVLVIIGINFDGICAFLERQKQRNIEYKLSKLEQYSTLFREGLITYAEFKKQTK